MTQTNDSFESNFTPESIERITRESSEDMRNKMNDSELEKEPPLTLDGIKLFIEVAKKDGARALSFDLAYKVIDEAYFLVNVFWVMVIPSTFQ